jgi:hypothetical protein
MISVRRAAERFRTEQPGITTWHSFSSGPHYDPANLSFGPVVACDEHLVDPGAGFPSHPHARVELVSWVLDGSLEHEDPAGRTRVVAPGQAQYQLAGTGIRHAERNASATEPLHFVQLWLLTDEDVPDYDLAHPPLNLSVGTFTVLRSCRGDALADPAVHLHVGTGHYEVAGHELRTGDSLRASDERLTVTGDGELLVVGLARSVDVPR